MTYFVLSGMQNHNPVNQSGTIAGKEDEGNRLTKGSAGAH